MRFLNEPLLSFDYGGVPFGELKRSANVTISCKEEKDFKDYELIYTLEGGLQVTHKVREFQDFNACEWVTYFKNTSEHNSKIISELYDGDVSFPFDYDEVPPSNGLRPNQDTAKIYNPSGSTWVRDEFCSKPDFILSGQERNYATSGGRSSQERAPFFDVNRKEKGIICAVGWTGQWAAKFTRDEKNIRIRTGIENVRFFLYPGEEIRTSSMVVLSYENGQTNGHNSFRRLVKKHFSLIGKEGRLEQAPLCCMFWGALSSDKMIERINKISENQLGYEYIWVDAGWYGDSQMSCANEFEGDWGQHTGSWNINTTYHLDEFRDVVKAIQNANMKFLLWIEPERVINNTKTPTQHPDWFLKSNRHGDTLLLDLGNEEALQGTIELVSNLIQKLNISCYRQDFNTDPLCFWRENDETDREGIHEIKHIIGLYQFWDTLLERFPHLIIDNCASGGRRIDIETLRRSVPLWRSDYQCTWNADPETAQIHTGGISWWIPYSGTGAGCVMGDDYRTRSCFCGSLVQSYWGYEDWELSENQQLDWVRKINSEYKIVRPYMSCDYYPLIQPSVSESDWAAMQFDRPEEKDGIILLFRRENSPSSNAVFQLGGLEKNKMYRFEDIDTGEAFDIASDSLMKNGFEAELFNKRSSKIYLYKALNS